MWSPHLPEQHGCPLFWKTLLLPLHWILRPSRYQNLYHRKCETSQVLPSGPSFPSDNSAHCQQTKTFFLLQMSHCKPRFRSPAVSLRPTLIQAFFLRPVRCCPKSRATDLTVFLKSLQNKVHLQMSHLILPAGLSYLVSSSLSPVRCQPSCDASNIFVHATDNSFRKQYTDAFVHVRHHTHLV